MRLEAKKLASWKYRPTVICDKSVNIIKCYKLGLSNLLITCTLLIMLHFGPEIKCNAMRKDYMYPIIIIMYVIIIIMYVIIIIMYVIIIIMYVVSVITLVSPHAQPDLMAGYSYSQVRNFWCG